MAAKCTIAPVVIWNWVIEALANFEEVDISTLIGIAKMNTEISCDIGKDAREMVSLRILESLFAHNDEAVEGSSAQNAKVSFDASKRCASVLRQILGKTPDGMANLEKGKWDVRPFLVHKRSSLPKCMLKKLKEAILEDRHPLLASLKEMSKLETVNTSENCDVQKTVAKDDMALLNPVDDNNYQGQVLQEADQVGNSTEGTTEHIGREECEMVIECPLEEFNGNKLMEHDDQLQTVTNSDRADDNRTDVTSKYEAKDDIAFLNPGIDDNNYQEKVLQEAGQVGNSAEGTTKHTGREECEMVIECPEGSNGNKLMEHDDQLQTVTNSNRVDDKRTDVTSKYEAKDDIAFLNSGIDDNNYQKRVLQEADQVGNSTEGTTKHIRREECEMGIECPLEGSNGNKLMEHDDQLQTVTNSKRDDDKRTDITSKYETFLKSHHTPNQDSLAGIEWSEIDLCMKCDEGGQLLVCSSDACPIRVHESCLGSVVALDENGKFFCPFCAYSRVMSEYREAERKASLARKNVQAFYRFTVKHTPNKSTRKQSELDKNEDRQIRAFDETMEGNRNRNVTEGNGCVEISCSRNLDKRKAQDTPAVPLKRRKILPWTKIEEETLKEGVQRYSSVDCKGIPWKEILDFGRNVFHKGRTPIDLKDKWRNICKGSPDIT